MDPREYDQLVQELKDFFANLGPDTDAAAVEEALGDSADGASPEEFTAAVRQALIESGADPALADQVIDQLEAQPGWGEGSPVEGLTVVVNNNQIVNEIDQSLHVDGEVHGDVIQQNTSNVANATATGAIAGDEVGHNQVQTGDGQQVGGDSGVQNQGDNSGQQAGGNADADNVTSGDNNTVGSGEASQIGQGQVSQDYATVNDSAQAFGSGSVDNTANDTSDSHYSESYNASADHSFNDSYEDNDTQTQVAETHDHGYEYEPDFESGDDYKGGDYHEHDGYDDHGHDSYDVDVDDHSIDQDAGILDPS
ncbi:MAG: hypothetical protein R2761_27695 [Acidimicrobiales bacterium]